MWVLRENVEADRVLNIIMFYTRFNMKNIKRFVEKLPTVFQCW